MNILIASPFLPWPLTEGGRAAQYRTFEALQGACTFTLVVPMNSLQEEADAKVFAGRFSNVTVEAVRCFQIPRTHSWGTRCRNTVRNFFRTMFSAPQSPPGVQTSQMPGNANPDYPFDNLHPNFVAAVEKHLSKGCDIFQAEFTEMMLLGPLMAGRVPTLLVHHQLHYVYARRFLEANKAANTNARYLTERMLHEEAAYLKTFDAAIVFSEVDRQALNQFCPQLAVHVSPFPSPEEPMPVALPFDQPVKRFVFVASESHRPNVDGLRWFMQDVWPTIKNQMPGAIIEVVGKWLPAAQTSLPHHGDIRFAGFAADLNKALQNKIMIVPLWIGSGIRTKILAAWSASCPVVTTTIGMEGLPGCAGEHFVVADDAPTFASACIALSQNLEKLNRLAANGLDLVKKNYSLAAVRKTRLEIYDQLLANHRKLKS
jgi:glycosyltransferase involved in cell wall biosynthesis